MAKTSKFIGKVNEHYKKKKESYSNKIDIKQSYETKMSVDSQGNHIIELINTKGKTVLKAQYDLIGFYNLSNSVWYWAWNIDLADKKLTKASIKMKEFPDYIKKNYKDFTPIEAEDYYFRTEMGNFYTNLENIHNLIKLTMYYMNSIWYIAVCSGKDGKSHTCDPNFNPELNKSPIIRFEYYMIKKILQMG